MLADTIDDEILVPELQVHSSSSRLERALTLLPYVITSGFKIPYPSNNDHVDIPLLLKDAIFFPD